MFRPISAALLAFCVTLLSGERAWTQVEPPDSVQAPSVTQAFYHLYNTSSYVPFDNIFVLYVTDGVEAYWGANGISEFISGVIDEDSTNTADVFPAVWDYFCYQDGDPSYGGVSYYFSYGPIDRIIIRLYDRSDFDCGSPSYDECLGYSWVSGNVLTLNATAMPVVEIVRDAFAHELQHICFRANWGSVYPNMYLDVNETLSTCAEYMWKAWEVVAPNTYDQSYDASIFRGERCDLDAKYHVEQLWGGYLYDVLKGSPNDVTDDVVYKWLRCRDTNGRNDITMKSLASVLADASYAWLGGATGEERLLNVFRNFLVAKFCDAPSFGADGRFGYLDLDPVADLGFFTDLSAWACYPAAPEPESPVDCPPYPGCPVDSLGQPTCSGGPCASAAHWNVRILPPTYTLGDWSDGVIDTVSGIYEDGDDTPMDPNDGDSSRDYIDVALWGTDYIVFRSGSFYQDDQGHVLKVWLYGDEELPAGRQVLASAIGYSSDEGMLQQHPENITFVEPVEVQSGTPSASIEVADFGRGVKSVVVALAYVESDPQTRWLAADDSLYFTYSYAYGVATPEIEAFSRVDGVLYAQPDTAAVGCPQGDADAVVITVGLDPDFYEGPITSTRFGVAVPDTSALYSAAQADSDATLIDGKYRTTITLDRFGACGLGDLTVLLDSVSIGNVTVDMRSVDINNWLSPGVVTANDFARFGVAYPSPPKAYDRCADYRPSWGQLTVSDFAYFGPHYNHSTGGGGMSPASAAAMTSATLRLDLQEEDPLVGVRRLWASLSVENAEPFTALVVSLRTDHPRLRFVGWEPDPDYASTTIGTEITRDGQKQAFIGILGSETPMEPVVAIGRVEFEVLGDEPLVLSDHDLEFLIADMEVPGGGLRAFSPLRLEKNEVQPTYRYELAQNVPNPFNPMTTIAYSLAKDSDVSLAIFDVRGARVKTLVTGREEAGVHRIPWDGTNDRGVQVSSGVYFYRIIAGTFRDTKKMVLLR